MLAPARFADNTPRIPVLYKQVRKNTALSAYFFKSCARLCCPGLECRQRKGVVFSINDHGRDLQVNGVYRTYNP